MLLTLAQGIGLHQLGRYYWKLTTDKHGGKDVSLYLGLADSFRISINYVITGPTRPQPEHVYYLESSVDQNERVKLECHHAVGSSGLGVTGQPTTCAHRGCNGAAIASFDINLYKPYSRHDVRSLFQKIIANRGLPDPSHFVNFPDKARDYRNRIMEQCKTAIQGDLLISVDLRV